MLFFQSHGYVSSPKQWFVVEAFLMEIAYTRNEHLCACFLMSSEGWIGSCIAEFEYGPHLNFVWKQRMLFRALFLLNIPFSWHFLRHLCINALCQWKEHVSWRKPMDALCFDAINAVFAFSWMWKRRAINVYCPTFVWWSSSFVCLPLLTMVDFSGWRHSFVHISIQWA